MNIEIELVVLVSFILLINVYFYYKSQQKITSNPFYTVTFRWTETFLGGSALLILMYPFIYAITKNIIIIFSTELILFLFIVWFTLNKYLKLYLFNNENLEVVYFNLTSMKIDNLIIPYKNITKAISINFTRNPTEFHIHYNENGQNKKMIILENGEITIEKLTNFLVKKVDIEIENKHN